MANLLLFARSNQISADSGIPFVSLHQRGAVLLKGDGYVHGAVDHSRKEYAWTDRETGTRFSTNGTESFWHLIQASVAGTHIHISQKHLDRYLG
jgi:ISXO2 transposase-like protein